MLPRITDPVVWQQAEILMQPAFIRVIDHIGKQLESSKWKGSYHDVLVWPNGTSEEIKGTVTQLMQQLETAAPEQATAIAQALSHLPKPQPEYHLCLKHEGMSEVRVDLWELCYQICFDDYNPSLMSQTDDSVSIDTDLIDETGDVDWQCLDAKAGELIEQIFIDLPSID